MAVNLANGADNVSVYTPLFRSLDTSASAIPIAVFLVLIGVWCAAGSWLGSHRRVIAVVERHGRWVVPVVFVAIGATIVLGSGVLTRS